MLNINMKISIIILVIMLLGSNIYWLLEDSASHFRDKTQTLEIYMLSQALDESNKTLQELIKPMAKEDIKSLLQGVSSYELRSSATCINTENLIYEFNLDKQLTEIHPRTHGFTHDCMKI